MKENTVETREGEAMARYKKLKELHGCLGLFAILGVALNLSTSVVFKNEETEVHPATLWTPHSAEPSPTL